MNSPKANDVKVFVPALDFGQSIRFYEAMGWTVNWRGDDDSLAELELANCRFYLQNYYNEDWANNFMMHITVDDAVAWYLHASGVIENGGYQSARLREPSEQPYGAVVTFVWDPSGCFSILPNTTIDDADTVTARCDYSGAIRLWYLPTVSRLTSEF